MAKAAELKAETKGNESDKPVRSATEGETGGGSDPVAVQSALLSAVFRSYERVVEQQQVLLMQQSDLRRKLQAYFTFRTRDSGGGAAGDGGADGT